jgi:hypothetical protein
MLHGERAQAQARAQARVWELEPGLEPGLERVWELELELAQARQMEFLRTPPEWEVPALCY